MNTKKIYYTTAAVIFSVIAIVHLARTLDGWEAVIDGWPVPMWVSWAAVVIAGYLAIRGFQLGAHHSKK